MVLLTSLSLELGRSSFLDQAEKLVQEVNRVLGRPKGLRIGEAPDRDGQYFHYLAMWIFALGQLGELSPSYKQEAIRRAKEIHPHFVEPGVGVHWKMLEDLSAPYPGFGYGALDAIHGYMVYQSLDPKVLQREILDMESLIQHQHRQLRVDQDLGLGMILWMSHFHPEREWAVLQRERALRTMDEMWVQPPGYFCRHPGLEDIRFAFTNHGVSLGLQAVDSWSDRVTSLNDYFEDYRAGNEYDEAAITWVMACTSHFPGLFLLKEQERLLSKKDELHL